MDLNMQIGYVEALVALGFLIVVGPVAQVVTLRVGFNGMRDDIRDIKTTCTTLVASTAEQNTDIAVHDTKIENLDDRVTKMEE